jgi:hypothetical protein
MFANAPSVTAWAAFFAAEVGATASLIGLVIVAISINLSSIISHPHLPGRAIETLVMLGGVLLVSSVGLVPGQPVSALGCEIFAIGVAAWLVSIATNVLSRNDPVAGKKWAPVLRIFVGQLATVPIVVSGAVVFVWGPVGLYWLLPSVVFCLIAGVMNAWVLLVEIVR